MSVIQIEQLSRRFGAKAALDGADLTVPRGVVFGLMGENGAGKTTLIRHVLGLYRAQEGRVRVFDQDPVADPAAVLARIGYLAEERSLPQWMTVDQILAYTRAFYPAWDQAFALELCETFELDRKRTLKAMSKGQNVRVALVLAPAHRPELLLLDEPSSGLDPVVRRDILQAVIRTVAEEGRTVLFSSHLLDEVEQVADHVAMIDQGQVILSEPIDRIQDEHHVFQLIFDAPPSQAPQLPGMLSCDGDGRHWTALCCRPLEELRRATTEMGARLVDPRVPSLEQVFFARRGA